MILLGFPSIVIWSLTGGFDTLTGTNADDTFTALSIQSSSSTPTTTFSAFDAIDGGDGEDTFNLYTDSVNEKNTTFPSNGSVKNVEIVNIYNEGTAFAALSDASKYTGVTQLWQIGTNAADVSNLAATTTAGFKSVEANTDADIDVAATATATSATIALDGVKGNATTNVAEIGVSGSALASVTVSGTLAQKTANTTAASLDLDVTAGKNVETLSVNSAVKTTLTVTEGAGSTKEIKTVDASASAGDITYAGAVTGGDAPSTIKTGAGNDTATIATATLKDNAATTSVDETVSALLETGAGKDTITINTSGDGTTTVNAGEGNDKVTLNADGSGVLTVNLGAGDDGFDVSGTGVVSGTDVIDGGEGTDTLLLKLVGAANIGAFSNFETFDTAGLAKTLDVDILASKNTVTEFVASADVGGGAILTNIGSGVNFRATGDMTTNAQTLTQKTAGALTVTLDADSASTTAQNDKNLKAVATNATSLKAVFDADSGYVQNGTNLNDQNITLTGTKATSLEVVSGGTNATNTLAYTSGAGTEGKDVLTSITVSGDQDLSVTVTEDGNSSVTAIDASALTGDLTISTAELKAESDDDTFDGGLLTLGAGDDVVTITQGAKISGIEKGTAENATTQSAFDVVKTGVAAAQAADVASTGTLNIKDGLLKFEGTGPSTLADAISDVDTQLTTDGDAVVFEYIGNSYVFVNNDTTADIVIQLTGVTGLTGLDEVGTTDNLYVF